MVPLKVSVSGDIKRRPRWEERSARWKGLRPEKLGEGQAFSWMGDMGKVEPQRVGWARGNSWRAQKPSFPALAHTTIFFSPQEKVIPSVVIQPASNNEGEGEHEGTVDAEYQEVTDDTALPGPTSEMPDLASEEEKAARAPQPAPSAPSASEAFQEVPPGFLYKVLAFILPFFFLTLFSVRKIQ